MLIVTAAGLAGVLRLETGDHQGLFASPVLPIALLIVGANGVIAVLLPYSAENYPLRMRGRGSGWVAGASKAGGYLIAQGLSLAALAPPLGVRGAELMAVPVAAAALLVALFGRETRGRTLAGMDRARRSLARWKRLRSPSRPFENCSQNDVIYRPRSGRLRLLKGRR